VEPLHAGVFTVVQRFRSDLGLYVHLHSLVTAAALREAADSRSALLHAAPELRAARLAESIAGRLSGRPLREPEWRRLAGHVHPGRRGERLLRRILRARTTRDLRATLQRLGPRRGRTVVPHAELQFDPNDFDNPDEDWAYYDDDFPEADVDGWPAPQPTAAQAAALAVLHDLAGAYAWPSSLGERLSLAQRAALVHRHPELLDTLDAGIVRMLGDPAPLRTLADLDLLAQARRSEPAVAHALDVDALLADLHAPAADLRLRCEALRLLAGEAAGQTALLAALPGLAAELRALVQLAVLHPDRHGASAREPAITKHLLCSDLAPRLMLTDPPGGLDPCPGPWRTVSAAARDVLRAGAGSLRGLDYPAFTLACRPSLSVVRPEHTGELRAIADELARLRAGLASDDPASLLHALAAVAGHDATIADADLAALAAHACAYAGLRAGPLRDAGAIREAHVRRFAARRHELAEPPPSDLAGLRRRFGEAPLIAGLVHAMLSFAREPPTPGPGRAVQRRVWTHRLRLLAALYELPPTPAPAAADEPEDAARALVEHLVRALEHAPLELALARGDVQCLGQLERRLRTLLRRGLQLADDDDAPAVQVELRPLTKRAALRRGELGRDCSSRYVPLRALSPHHTYYGLFTADAQRPGYVAVFEAFAEPASGGRVPVLVLETVNVPDGALDGVHQDLLLALDAIAEQRGLAGLAVVTGIGTWNYPNERLVAACRRHRQGAPVRLLPPDPPLWRAFERLTQEAGHYCAFRAPQQFRLLAAFDRGRDLVQPENAAEAARLRAVPARAPIVTARDSHGEPAAFITAVPDRE
jgi:hypothetical protein